MNKPQTLEDLKFANYFKEIYFDSDTKVALISGSGSEEPRDWFLTNEMKNDTRARVNAFAGSKRMMSHAIFMPGMPGWLDAVDKAIETLKPDAFKGYTVGDNTNKHLARRPWRMDDEKLVYPFYEKIVKAGYDIVCVHKGLYPSSVSKRWPHLVPYASVDDVAKAAKRASGLKGGYLVIEYADGEREDHFVSPAKIDRNRIPGRADAEPIDMAVGQALHHVGRRQHHEMHVFVGIDAARRHPEAQMIVVRRERERHAEGEGRQALGLALRNHLRERLRRHHRVGGVAFGVRRDCRMERGRHRDGVAVHTQTKRRDDRHLHVAQSQTRRDRDWRDQMR